ncbi:unnamed protein product [Symbiodinium microadriaticum]|nr:unnamed protein product [Symbiodinium microadriaticum]
MSICAVLLLTLVEGRGPGRPPPPQDLSLGPGYLDSLLLSHEGVRRETYWSGTAYPRSCESTGANYGLPGEDLPWSKGRSVFRSYVAADAPTSEEQEEMSALAWDLSRCWCTCGSCSELLQVCPLGALTALNLMRVTSSVNIPSRVASFVNTVSVCSHMDPYVLMTKVSHWPELLLSSWPIFGSIFRLSVQVLHDGLHEGHLDGIFAAQVEQAPAEWKIHGRTWVAAESFCELLGFRPTEQSCPLLLASVLVRQALMLAGSTKSQAIDAIETLVGRAQVLRSSTICPAAHGSRWQGEWLLETDFLKDFESQLSYESLQHEHLRAPTGAPKPPKPGQKQAWVCTLFAGPEVPESQVALHAELIRTLAHSVRRHSWHSRPFVVLTEASIPDFILRELLADGLLIECNLCLAVRRRNFLRQVLDKYFDASPLLMQVPQDFEWKLSWFSGRGLTPTMGQLAVWNLTGWDTLVMLDDDMLMLKPADELFSIPVFAMSHDPTPIGHALDDGGQRTRLNNAARVVQPSAKVFNAMVAELQSGMYKDHPLVNFWGYDLQTLEDAFWSRRSRRSGLATFDDTKSFQGCTIARPGLARKKQQSLADALPDEAEARRLREFERIDPKEEVHCVLPADYNFFVDFVSVFHLVYYSISQEELGSWSTRQLMRRAAKMLRQSGSLMDEPRIIHWPGSLRKPWQRIHPRSRSSWDQMWWDAHADMCRQAASPCRISCRLGQPAE